MTTAHVTPFQTRGLFLAWGVGNGDWTADTICARASAAGFRWVAQQLPLDPAKLQQLRDGCRTHHLLFGVWGSQPLDWNALTLTPANLVIFNIEEPAPDAGYQLVRFRAHKPHLPAGVVTNFGGLPNRGERDHDLLTLPWLEHGIWCLPECYTMPPPQGNPQATVPAQVFQARQRGWNEKSVLPVLGVYDSWPLSRYEPLPAAFAVYLAEEMQAADWQLLGAHP